MPPAILMQEMFNISLIVLFYCMKSRKVITSKGAGKYGTKYKWNPGKQGASEDVPLARQGAEKPRLYSRRWEETFAKTKGAAVKGRVSFQPGARDNFATWVRSCGQGIEDGLEHALLKKYGMDEFTCRSASYSAGKVFDKTLEKELPELKKQGIMLRRSFFQCYPRLPGKRQ